MDRPRPFARAALPWAACAALLLVSGSAAAATTVPGSTLTSDTTWTLAGSPYTVTGEVIVGAAATLTVEAGVTVRFNTYCGLTVNGRLVAVGTGALPITFTTSAANPTRGAWDGISIAGVSTAPISGSVLDHVVIEFGGYNDANLRLGYASATVSNSTIQYSGGAGIRGYAGGVVDVSSTSFVTNDGYAIDLDDGSMNPTFAALTGTGNGTTARPDLNAIALGGGTLSGVHTWPAAGLRYEVTGDVIVAAGARLVVAPGVEVRFATYTGIRANGTLTAVGTATLPIIFSGINGVRGAWDGIAVDGLVDAPNTTSAFDHVLIDYGGYNDANLTLSYATVPVTNSVIRNSDGDGIRGYTGAVVNVSDTTFTGNLGYAIHLDDGSMDPALARITASGNTYDGIAMGAGTLTGDTRWEAAGLEYHILGDTTVAAGGSLEIDAGVRVLFGTYCGLTAYGPVVAHGTPDAPIVLTRHAATGDWDGVSIAGNIARANVGSQFDYVAVEYGGYSGASVQLSYASLVLRDSAIRNGSDDGLVAHVGASLDARDTAFTGNAGYAIALDDATIDPSLSALTLTGNGHDGVAVGGGTMTRSQRWEATGLSYFVHGDVYVEVGASLTIEPGTAVVFSSYCGLSVRGTLLAGGTAGAPIVFTAANGTAGGWDGLKISGVGAAGGGGVVVVALPADVHQNVGSILDHVVIEYGGYNGANLTLDYAQVVVMNSTIQNADGDGVYASNAAGTVIDQSQIIGNGTATDYGVRNVTPTQSATNPFGGDVLAAHVWWGNANGPTEGACNPAGSGSRITSGVLYKPFLTAATQQVGPAAPLGAYTISLSPDRWYAPADGTSRVWVKATVLAGDGAPMPGKQVRLASTLASSDVTDGGITDVAGQTFAYVTATAAGEAVLTATLDGNSACEPVRSGTTTVTFTAEQSSKYISTSAPYASNDIEVSPLPITVGVPSKIRAKFTNPNDVPITVDAQFAFAQLGIGLTFGPIGTAPRVTIPAHTTAYAELPWTPLVSGHFCIQMDYTIGSGAAAAGLLRTAGSTSGRVQDNKDGQAGSMCSPAEKAALERAKTATQWGRKGIGTAMGPVGKGMTIPIQLFGYILDFNFSTWSVAIAALQADPPTHDYRRYVMLETFTFDPVPAGSGVSQALADAANALTRAELDVRARIDATQASLDRYGGASAAGDSFWASQQASSYLYYKRALGSAFVVLADRMDAFVAALHAAGIDDLIVPRDAAVAYIQRLQTTGWNDLERQAAAVIHASDAQLAQLRLDTIAAGVDAIAGDNLTTLRDLSAAFRALGPTLQSAANFSQGGGGVAGASVGQAALDATAAGSTAGGLVRLYTTQSTIQVGNPLTARTLIALTARTVDMPPDWKVALAPTSVTLDPGQSTTITVAIQAGAPVAQGARPRVAIEGFAGTTLVSGVVLDVQAPSYVAMAQTCAPGTKAEGASCSCSLECGGTLMCAPTASGSVCLSMCDTGAGSCPHAGQTCQAVATGTTAGVCTPAFIADGSGGSGGPGGGGTTAPVASSSKGCGCGSGPAGALELLLALAPLLVRRRRVSPRCADR